MFPWFHTLLLCKFMAKIIYRRGLWVTPQPSFGANTAGSVSLVHFLGAWSLFHKVTVLFQHSCLLMVPMTWRIVCALLGQGQPAAGATCHTAAPMAWLWPACRGEKASLPSLTLHLWAARISQGRALSRPDVASTTSCPTSYSHGFAVLLWIAPVGREH